MRGAGTERGRMGDVDRFVGGIVPIHTASIARREVVAVHGDAIAETEVGKATSGGAATDTLPGGFEPPTPGLGNLCSIP